MTFHLDLVVFYRKDDKLFAKIHADKLLLLKS